MNKMIKYCAMRRWLQLGNRVPKSRLMNFVIWLSYQVKWIAKEMRFSTFSIRCGWIALNLYVNELMRVSLPNIQRLMWNSVGALLVRLCSRFDFSMWYRCRPQSIASRRQGVQTLRRHVMPFHHSEKGSSTKIILKFAWNWSSQIITGNKYKFGLYFKSSWTTADSPLCAALNSGVAPSYIRKKEFKQVVREFETVNSTTKKHLHNERHQHALHSSIVHGKYDRDPFGWRSTKDSRRRSDMHLDYHLRLTALAKQHDDHSVMRWKQATLDPVNLRL